MVEEMEEKFSKYWEEYTPILSMKVVLDPRYKLKFVKFCCSKLDSLTCNEKAKVIEDNLERLFEEYMKSPASNSALVESTIDECDTEMRDEMDEFDLFASQPESSSEKTQLKLYLEEPVLDRKGNANLDVLKFWKDNMNRFPELSLMAHDILSIPISTVVSESTFSIGGRVIGRYQSSILLENAEAKLCAQDWLYEHGAVDDSDKDDMTIDVESLILGSDESF